MNHLFTFILLLSLSNLLAQDCAPGWQFYRAISVDNTSGQELTDYQVLVELNTAELVAAGSLQPNGQDLRVYLASDCTPLAFWGDSLGLNDNTRIFVKVPTVAAGATAELQLYYGRPQAETGADGDATFMFFDDFNTDEVDTTKWEAIGEFAQFNTVDGKLLYGSTGQNPGPRFKFARTKPSFTGPAIFEYAGTVSNNNGFGFSSADQTLERILFRQAGFGFDTLNQVAVLNDTFDNGFSTIIDYPLLGFPRNVQQTHSITIGVNDNSNIEARRYANVGLGTENTETRVLANFLTTGIHFILSSFSDFSPVSLDYLAVRQAVLSPPSTSVGPELMATPSNLTSFALTADQVKIFPNPATTDITVQMEYREPILIQLFDASGRQTAITTSAELPANWQINLTDLEAGNYYVRILDQASKKLLYTQSVIVVR